LTIQNVPLASGVTLSYLSPVFTTVLAIFFLGESVRAIQWLFFGMSFLGVFIIKGFDANFPTFYFLTGMTAAFFSGVAYNLVRTMKERENPLVIVLHFQFVGVGAGFIACLFQLGDPNRMGLGLSCGDRDSDADGAGLSDTCAAVRSRGKRIHHQLHRDHLCVDSWLVGFW
jgi:drug/metabolite transporter (DMT)-like permease